MRILQGKKRVARPFGRTERLSFDSFAWDFSRETVGDVSTGKTFIGNKGQNCFINKGALTAGVGLTPFTLGGVEIPAIAGVKASRFFLLPILQEDGSYVEKLGLIDADGVLYYYEQGADSFVSDRLFGGEMQPIVAMDKTGKTYALFAGGGGLWHTMEEGVSAVLSSGVVPIACVYKNRVFCVVEPFTIAYSAALAPTDFADSIDDGGKISFPNENGKIVGLTPLEKGVYVFYEYGISKLTLSGRAREFTMEKMEYNGGRIVQGSMGVCALKGEKAFFLAEDGLYAFDGKSAKRICKNLHIKPLEGIQVCDHAVGLGKYFLTFEKETDVQIGVVVDVETEEGYYSFPFEGLSTCRGKAVCLSEEKARTVVDGGEFPSGAVGRFNAFGVRFGKGMRTLKTITFEGDGEICVTVRSGYKRVEKRLVFEDGRACMRVWLRGETFDFTFEPDKNKNSVVRRLDVELGVCEYADEKE